MPQWHMSGLWLTIDVAERRVAVVARPAEHEVFAADLARKQHAVAIERQERIFQPLEGLKIARRRDADRRTVVSAAPRDVVRPVDLAQARIVRVIGRRLRIAFDKLDRLRFDLPIDPVIAPANVQVRKPATLLEAEHADETVAVRRHRAVVNALHARHVVPADDRVGGMPPDDVAATGRPFLPGNRPLLLPTPAAPIASPVAARWQLGTRSRFQVAFHQATPSPSKRAAGATGTPIDSRRVGRIK